MRKQLSKSEIKEINLELEDNYGLQNFFSKKDNLIVEDILDYKVLKTNKVLFFEYEGRWVPILKLILENNFLKKITVDTGAVKFVVNGADVMRPGITKVDEEIKENEIIVIVDETHSKPLAIGLTLFDSQGINEQKTGKSLVNLHQVGDKLWGL
jgi:PUA-domain protein